MSKQTYECQFKDKIETMEKHVADTREDVSYIRGKIDGMENQKEGDITFYGMLSALIVGLWNLIK